MRYRLVPARWAALTVIVVLVALAATHSWRSAGVSSPAEAASGGPEMVLNVKGGDCDDATRPTKCNVAVGGKFSLSVELTVAPEPGYFLFQTFIDYGSDISYQKGVPAEEIVWPDLGSELVAFRSQFGTGLVSHGAETGIVPPFPTSHFVGNIVELSFVCSAGISTTLVRLVPDGDPIAITSGSLLIYGDFPTRVIPKVGNLTINCVDAAPAAVGGVALGGELRGIAAHDRTAPWLWATLGFGGAIVAMSALTIVRRHAASR